jgi:hypothetical protein
MRAAEEEGYPRSGRPLKPEHFSHRRAEAAGRPIGRWRPHRRGRATIDDGSKVAARAATALM